MRFKRSKTSPASTEKLGEFLTEFRRKYVKPQSMVTAKPRIQRLVFNPLNQKLIDFLDELQKWAEDAFRVAAQAIIEQFIYAKMPPHLKKLINQALLVNGTFEKNTSHLETEFEPKGLDAPDELQINTVAQSAAKQNPEKTQTNLSPLEKTRSLSKSTQTRERPGPKQHN